MPLSVNWATDQVIFIPQADLTPLGGDKYELNVNAFRLELKDLEASVDGMPFTDTHRHNTEIVLAGATYARAVEIMAPYTVEFEDVGTPYTVVCVGANHNVGDVKVVNQVSLIVGNAAGLVRSQEAVDTKKLLRADVVPFPDGTGFWLYEEGTQNLLLTKYHPGTLRKIDITGTPS